MQTETTGTFIGGLLKLDTPPLADNTRVKVIIEPADYDGPTAAESLAILEGIWERLQEKPIYSGEKFNREELYDRRTPAAAWGRLMARLQQNPINTGGDTLSRDALYECR